MSNSSRQARARAAGQTARSSGNGALIAVMTAAALMDMLDVTVVNVALPTIRERLHATPAQLEWIVAGYALMFGATLIFWGRVGDLAGRRKLFLSAVAVFGLASLAAGVSRSPAELIVARLVTGVAAGALVPQVLATFRSALDEKTRIVAFGIYGAVAGLAAAVGVVLGALLTQYSIFGLGWRSVFLVNVPMCLVVLPLAARTVPESQGSGGRVDTIGAVVLAGSIAAIVFPLIEGESLGWPIWTFVMLAGGLAAVAALVIIEYEAETRGGTPVLQVSQFRYRAFSSGIAVQGLFSMGLQGFSFTLIVWLQVGHQFTPLKAGLSLVAFSAGAIITAPQAGELAQRAGNRILMLGGVLLSIGTLTVAIPAFAGSRAASLWPLLIGLVTAGAGLGLLVVPLVNVVLAAVPAESAGGASGTFSTAQQLGGAIGIAVIGTIFFAQGSSPHLNQSFEAAAPIAATAYIVAALLCLMLPKRAVSEEEVIEIG